MERQKIVQICTGEYDNSVLFALTNHGRMFSKLLRGGEWEEIEPIPDE